MTRGIFASRTSLAMTDDLGGTNHKTLSTYRKGNQREACGGGGMEVGCGQARPYTAGWQREAPHLALDDFARG